MCWPCSLKMSNCCRLLALCPSLSIPHRTDWFTRQLHLLRRWNFKIVVECLDRAFFPIFYFHILDNNRKSLTSGVVGAHLLIFWGSVTRLGTKFAYKSSPKNRWLQCGQLLEAFGLLWNSNIWSHCSSEADKTGCKKTTFDKNDSQQQKCDQKKSQNVYKKLPKMISLEKW